MRPKNVHKKVIKAGLRPISLKYAKEVKRKKGIILIPGKKICDNCRKKLPYKDQICTPEEMFKICDQHFSKITFQFINTDNVKNVEPMLTLRFSDHKTVGPSRSVEVL